MGKKKVVLTLLLLLVASWVFFGGTLWIISESEEKIRQDISNRIEFEIDDLRNQVNSIWEERVFAKEMRENLDYYLPEGYTSKATYVGFAPLDFEIGRARVYSPYRRNDYWVDFSYSDGSRGFEIERASDVNLKTD